MTFLEATDLRMMRNLSFELSRRLYWQRENCVIFTWRYDVEKKLLIENYNPVIKGADRKAEPKAFYAKIHTDDFTCKECDS